MNTFWWNLKLKNSQIKILWCWSWMVVIALCGCNGRYSSSTSTIFNSWHKLDKMTNFAQNALRRIEKFMENVWFCLIGNSVASAVIRIYYSKRLIGFLWWLVLPSQCWVWIFVAEEECNHFVAFSNGGVPQNILVLLQRISTTQPKQESRRKYQKIAILTSIYRQFPVKIRSMECRIKTQERV